MTVVSIKITYRFLFKLKIQTQLNMLYFRLLLLYSLLFSGDFSGPRKSPRLTQWPRRRLSVITYVPSPSSRQRTPDRKQSLSPRLRITTASPPLPVCVASDNFTELRRIVMDCRIDGDVMPRRGNDVTMTSEAASRWRPWYWPGTHFVVGVNRECVAC